MSVHHGHQTRHRIEPRCVLEMSYRVIDAYRRFATREQRVIVNLGLHLKFLRNLLVYASPG
jgi:hypothetical protein